jgi:hypothetical protein
MSASQQFRSDTDEVKALLCMLEAQLEQRYEECPKN